MQFDLISATALTASAAIVIAVLSVAMARESAARFRLAVALSGWFVVVVALGVSRALSADAGIGTPGLGLAVVLPLLVIAGLTLGTASGRSALANAPLPRLIAVHTLRVIGVTLLLLYAAGRLPGPFAPLAGWGDIIVGISAPFVAWNIARNPFAGRMVALAWNLLGSLDLLVAIGLGVASAPGALRLFAAGPSSAIMTNHPWLLIPAFLVPLFLATHLALFARLAGRVGMREHALA